MSMQKKITEKEIAQLAGVSIGTVDRVIHNRGNVNKEKEARVRAICDQYGYASNIVGRAMAMQKKSSVIAIVINSRERNTFSAMIHDGVERKASEVRDYNVVFKFYDIFENTVSEMSMILDTLYDEDISGLIVKPIDSPIIKYKLLRIANEKRVPIISCTSKIDGINTLCYVGQDHYKLGRMMACTLTKVNHDFLKIIVVVGPLTGYARREKLEGFLSFFQEKTQNYKICSMIEVPFDDDIAYQLVLDGLKNNPEANALYIHAPELKPCLKALSDYGCFKGTKFSFGNTSYLRDYLLSGQLDFTIDEDPFNQGYYAAEAMFNYLLEGIKPSGDKILEGRIIFDENC